MKARWLLACLLLGCAQSTEAATADASVTAAPRTTSGAPSGAMKHLRTALTRSTQNLRVERRAERLHVDMNGTFQTASVITLDPQGQPSKLCLDNTAQLDHMLGEVP